ncbi:MAG: alpha/beta fold hydrolase [Cytophagales bacterium]|nr:alpha/beta fold hydrolase [Rhizobacter sp.]
MRRLATLIFSIVVLIYAAACGALYLFQRSLIYFPQAHAVDTPVIEVRPDLLASVREHTGPDAVIYFGGNGEDVSPSLQPLAEAFPQHALYLLHYRGYGGSGGKPTEAAITEDALALFDSVHARHPNVVVIGRSLGTGVAVRLASQRPVTRLVLVTPYDSLQELAVQQFRYFPVRWLLTDKFESWRYVATVKAPTLLIAAENDEVIPRASTEQLFARFGPGRATLRVLPRVSHNTVSQHPLYLPLLSGTQPSPEAAR